MIRTRYVRFCKVFFRDPCRWALPFLLAGSPLAALAQPAPEREPPPVIERPSTILGHAVAPVRAALGALDRGDCPSALDHAAGFSHPGLKRYVRRQTFFAGCADFETIADYIERHGAHGSPRRRRALRLSAEKSMRPDRHPRRIVAWAENHPPLSGVGAIRHIEALWALGLKDQAIEGVRRYWREKNFSRADETLFLRRYRRHWTQGDNLTRLDRLLWEGRRRAAARTLGRIRGPARRLPAARLALQSGAGDVDRRIAALSAPERADEGLRHDRLVWRLRRGRENAAELLDPPPEDPSAGRWWKARLRLVRRQIDRQQFEQAYRLGTAHHLDRGQGFSESEWIAGWIALRHLDRPRRAYDHFHALYERGEEIYRPRAAYWSGRACEAFQGGDCLDWYRRAARFPHTFYGQMAAQRLGQSSILRPAPSLPSDPAGTGEDAFLTAFFAMLGYADRAGKLLDEQFARARTALESRDVIALAERLGFFHRAVRFEIRHNERYHALSGYGYPDPFFLPPMASLGVESSLRPVILALIRNESAFRIHASSRAGAGGLMQLMPGTAREVARRLKLTYSRRKLRTDPHYNLRIGSAYLRHMLRRYDSFLPLALAAYNAGPRWVDFWIRRQGDPRRLDGRYLADWIEGIPFAETRRYVRKVLADSHVYRHR